jgi:transcriptional regulator with GAF, ATPase, and Fis domain
LAKDYKINKWKPGEGYIGTCYAEGHTILITNVPEGYAKLTSGLGETIPNTIYMIPLKYNEITHGVLEVASLKQLEDYKLRFLEKIAENITSFITISNANERAESLLKQADMQRKELESQEEELRQNMEEMMATQEDMKRKEEIWIKEKRMFIDNEALHLSELNKLKGELKIPKKD